MQTWATTIILAVHVLEISLLELHSINSSCLIIITSNLDDLLIN